MPVSAARGSDAAEGTCLATSAARGEDDRFMTPEFPNRAGVSGTAVRFSGYDGMLEVWFFIEADALLLRNVSQAGDVSLRDNCLAAFDAQRPSIQRVARSIHAGTRRGSYTLTSADLL